MCGDALPFLRRSLHTSIEVIPSRRTRAVVLGVGHALEFERGDVLRYIELLPDRGIGCHYGGLDRCRVDTVLDVMLLKHESSRDQNCSHLVERYGDIPELVVVLQDDEDHIPLPDPVLR